MKKVLKVFGFSALAVVAGASMAVAAPSGGDKAICDLVAQLGGTFKLLRNLAFVGAAFTIAGWAWGFISKGEVKLEVLKDKGTGMLVGFILLFCVGMVLQFIMAAADPNGGSLGCEGAWDW